MNNFFKHNDKVYSENLNDSVLVGNAFSWSISIDLPTDSDALFPRSSDVVKAKVADVYATPNSNLSIGSTIENSSGSSQVYRLTVYPNFNRYGGFTFVSLEGDGSVIITEKGGTSPVRNNLDYANLGNVTELKTLREYDIVVTIPSGGEVTGLSFGFKSSSADVTASISQANVDGLTSGLSNLNTEVWGSNTQRTPSRIDNLEASTNDLADTVNSLSTSISNNLSKINSLSREVWNNTSQTGTSRIDSLEDNVSSLSTSITNHIEDLTWFKFYDYDGVQMWTNKALKLSYLQFNKNVSVGASSTTTMKNDYSSNDEKIPYCPPTSTYCSTSIKDVYLTVNYSGGIKIINRGSALSNQSLQGMMVFKAKG